MTRLCPDCWRLVGARHFCDGYDSLSLGWRLVWRVRSWVASFGLAKRQAEYRASLNPHQQRFYDSLGSR